MSVVIQFTDPSIPVLEEVDAVNFGYNIGKYGEMTVVLVDASDSMLSVHTGVRSAWRTPTAVTTAIDISSLPKKTE